jgi:hypothetical protein
VECKYIFASGFLLHVLITFEDDESNPSKGKGGGRVELWASGISTAEQKILLSLQLAPF